MFSANVRLSEDVSQEEKEKRVDDAINALGLKHCADTKVWCATMPNMFILSGDSLQNYVTGGNGVHSGSFWWRTKANEHRNGTHCIAVHLVSWRTDDRPRRQHCKRCHWHPQTVSKLQTTATNVSSSASTWRHVWSCYYTTEIWRVDMSLRSQVIFFIETRFSTQ